MNRKLCRMSIAFLIFLSIASFAVAGSASCNGTAPQIEPGRSATITAPMITREAQRALAAQWPSTGTLKPDTSICDPIQSASCPVSANNESATLISTSDQARSVCPVKTADSTNATDPILSRGLSSCGTHGKAENTSNACTTNACQISDNIGSSGNDRTNTCPATRTNCSTTACPTTGTGCTSGSCPTNACPTNNGANPTTSPVCPPTTSGGSQSLSQGTDGHYTPGALTSQENSLYLAINAERVSYGLSSLPIDQELSELARVKSEDMVNNNYFAHESPTYGNSSQMLKSAGYSFTSVGENIAKSASVEKGHAALMSSDGHRRNILGSQWTRVGIGVANDKNGYPYITELFVR